MNRVKPFRLLQTLTLLVFALSWGDSALVAQQECDVSEPPAQQQQEQPVTAHQNKTCVANQLLEVATFRGKVLRSGNTLVLEDSIGESTYLLDDQLKAKAVEGKNVKVKGVVDAATNTIYIAKIEPEI